MERQMVYDYEWWQHYATWLVIGLVGGLITVGKTYSPHGFWVTGAVMALWWLFTYRLRWTMKENHRALKFKREREERDRKAAEKEREEAEKHWAYLAERLGCSELQNLVCDRGLITFTVYYLSPTGELRVGEGGLDQFVQFLTLTDFADRPRSILIEAAYRDSKKYMLAWPGGPQLWTLEKFEIGVYGVILRDFAYPRSRNIKLMIHASSTLAKVALETLRFVCEYTSVSNATLRYIGREGAKILSSHECSGDQQRIGGVRVCLQLGEEMWAKDYWGETQFNPYHWLGERDPGRPEPVR